jgi:hypothetical protein
MESMDCKAVIADSDDGSGVPGAPRVVILVCRPTWDVTDQTGFKPQHLPLTGHGQGEHGISMSLIQPQPHTTETAGGFPLLLGRRIPRIRTLRTAPGTAWS